VLAPAHLAALGAALGALGLLAAAAALLAGGAPVLVRSARILGVLGLLAGAAGAGWGLVAAGDAIDPRNAGAGSLLGLAAMLLFTFGAARAAERRRVARQQAARRPGRLL
jgi:hypothetical protein